MMLFSAKKSPSGEPRSKNRRFPTETYWPYPDEDDSVLVLQYVLRYRKLLAESLAMSHIKRVMRATRADQRVTKGPTREDLAAIPWLDWGWDWTSRVLPEVGIQPGHLRYGVLADLMAREVAAARSSHEEGGTLAEARKRAGVDPAWVLVEHNALPQDVNPMLDSLNGHYGKTMFCLFEPDKWDYLLR
jgi:hypothetical protein